MKIYGLQDSGLKNSYLRAAIGLAIGAVVITGCGSNATKSPDAPADTSATAKPALTPDSTTPVPASATPTQGKGLSADLPAGLPKGWKNFRSSGGGYSVWMPGEVETKVTPVTTELGTIPAQIASAGTADSAYLVIYADYPAEMTKADPQKILDGARNGAIQRLGGKLENQRKITINGFPGSEFSAVSTADKQKRFVKARIYLVRSRLYQQIVVVPQDKKPVEQINAFLNSLKIQAKQAKKE